MGFYYFLLLFWALLMSSVHANDAVWNCHQDKTSKEWVCSGEKAPAAGTPAPIEHKPEPITSPQPEPESIATPEPGLKEIEAEETAPKIDTATVTKPAETAIAETVVSTEPAPVSRKVIKVREKLGQQEEMRQAGWNCRTAEGGDDWNCSLTGRDPKGETHIVASDERVFSLLDPAFDAKQEQIFTTLTSNLKYDPWAQCSVEPRAAPAFTPGKDLRDISPLDVKANYGEVFDNEISSYRGNVEIVRADQRSLSHSAQYDTVSQTLDLQGDVYYSEDSLALYSNSATLKLASDQATLRNVQFIDPSAPFRGRASSVYRDSKVLSRYEDVAYTSCRPGNRDWVVHASDLKINDEVGRGSAKNAWLEFKGVPVFYSPYLSFPTDDRRQSGFLAPSFGNTQRSGFNLSLPYYWNIAPNYDATFRPREFTKRGIMLAGDFRMLTKYNEGMAAVQYMPHDSLRDDSRFLGTLKNKSRFGPNVYSNMDLNYVSDKDYFGELGNALSFPNFSHVRSYADLGYINNIYNTDVSVVGKVENYQTIDKTLEGYSRPYKRLPEVDLALDHAFDGMPLNASFGGEYVNFQHKDLVDGSRFNIKPSVSAPLQSEWGFTIPKVSLQNTNYVLTNQTPGNPESISRTLPIFSLDNGLFFERELDFASSSYKHTLEPRLFYLYIPRKNQNDIPIFDTTYYDYWFVNLYRENRFSGVDRIQDANQVTVGLTSRLLDDSGRERLKFSLGEIVYFQDREVNAPVRLRYLPVQVQGIPPEGLLPPTETETLSPLIAELGGTLSDYWKADSGIQWNPQNNAVVGGKAALHYVDENQKIFNASFLFRQNDLVYKTLKANQDVWYSTDDNYSPLEDKKVLTGYDMINSDFTTRWPLFNDWHIVGRWTYSWLFNKTQEAFLGFEKENCCWRFRVIGRRWTRNYKTINSVNSSQTEGDSQTGIFFQIEFKGLTGLGEDLESFFENSIYGYRKPEK